MKFDTINSMGRIIQDCEVTHEPPSKIMICLMNGMLSKSMENLDHGTEFILKHLKQPWN
jgi:hypothetical protein